VLFENIVNDRFLRGNWNVEWIGILAVLSRRTGTYGMERTYVGARL
jgi:hypothetical protein